MRHFETRLPNSPHNTVGKSTAHDSAITHVTGRAHYIDDQPLPADALHAYPVMAPIARGTLVGIDASTVQQWPGVVAVLTAADIPGRRDIGPIFPGDVLLVEDTIHFHGQPVAVVVAETYELARRAARAVSVQVAETRAQTSVQQSVTEQCWVRPPFTLTRGDIDKGFARAKHELSGEVHLGGQEHFYLEGQVALVTPTDDGGLFVKCSTQHPSEVQHLVADVLKKPMQAVTVEMRRMGGGFGGKETQAAQWAILAAMAAEHTGRAVKLRLARSDDFRLTGKRHPFWNRYRVGFDNEGRILAADIEVNGNCGYSPDLSDSIVDRAMFHVDNSYFYEQVRVTGHRAKTDTVSHTAFRGFGGPQGMIVAESIMDDIARYLNKDPADVRRVNLYSHGRDQTPYHQTVEQFVVGDMMQTLMHNAQYEQRRTTLREFNRSSPIVRKGLSITPVKFGISFTAKHLNQAGALVNVYTDGSILLNHGGTEMGQGLNVKVQQIVAQAFGVPLESVGISATRTDKVPNTSPTAASSGSDLNGMAALNAANTIKQRLIELLVTRDGADANTVVFENGQVSSNKGQCSFAALTKAAHEARISLSSTGYFATPKVHFDRAEGKGRPFFYFAHGVAMTEVDVDTLTGELAVTRVDILHDVGHSLNPAIDIGQIEGGFVQGMGWLTTEDLRWDNNGVLASAGPATYKIPAIGDMPAQFNVELYDSANPETSVFRSKAVGEPPFMLANSVWCAIRDAVSSLSDYRYSPPLAAPATPESILNSVNATRDWCAQQQEADHVK